MIQNIRISNYLSCSLSGQITKVLLYCHHCVYIYWAFHNYSADSLFSPMYQGKASFISWLSARNFFGGESIVMQISIVFYCFRTKFQGGAKVFGGGLPQGAPLCPPPPRGRKPVSSPGQRKLVITSIHWKIFTKIGYIFTLKTDNKLLSSFGNNRLVPLTTHFIANALIDCFDYLSLLVS